MVKKKFSSISQVTEACRMVQVNQINVLSQALQVIREDTNAGV